MFIFFKGFVFFLRCIAGQKGLRATAFAASFFVWPLGLLTLPAQDLLHSNFDQTSLVDNPWGGANSGGLLSVIPGAQLAVDDNGSINETQFAPSVSVGDLNGDGLLDLVIGDSSGFIWYFPNSGTATEPKFTHGEIMPVWLGFSRGDPLFLGDSGANNVVPRVQLRPMGDNGKLLNLIVGNYAGRLFNVPNVGSEANPSFNMPRERADLIINTKKRGALWCNFISPFFYDWWGTGKPDLIMGDGSYSANSIYLFKNQGDSGRPIYNEDQMIKIIPGMGREHLTPQVVDWNNDGKPDIIAGERTGHINLFLNTSKDPKTPTFDEGQYVKLGGNDTFGQLTTVTVCDLTGNKLPNLIITSADGTISYATNTGKLGSPAFSTPVAIHGVNPFPQILRPAGWHLESPNGVPHELLVTTNASVQPGFIAPPNTAFKSALRYYVYPIKNTYFKDFYYPRDESLEPHNIVCDNGFTLTEDADYDVSLLVRTTGNIKNLSYSVRGWATYTEFAAEEVNMGKEVGSSESWGEFDDTIHFHLLQTKEKGVKVGFGFSMHWFGQGEVYLDDVRIRPSQSQ